MDIPIRINISLLIFLPILAWLLARPEQIGLYAGLIESISGRPIDSAPLITGQVPIAIGITTAVALFISVLLHELGHSWMARRYDIPISSITLWIFGGVASLERVPKEWNREFWIALAGPIVSVALGVGSIAIMMLLPSGFPIAIFLIGWVGVINLILAFFNMLPAFPMDGGRIFRALLARNRPYVDATRTAARVGRFIAIGLAVLGVFAFNVIMLLVALFVYTAATSESRLVVLDALLDGVVAGDLMSRDFRTVSESDTVESLIEHMMRDRMTGYPVVDAAGTLVGIVSLSNLRDVSPSNRENTTVADIMSRSVKSIDADRPAMDVLTDLSKSGVDRLIVRVADEPVGIISREDIGAALTVLQGLGEGKRPPGWVDGVR